MGETKPKRPNGLIIIAILWILSGLANIFLSFQTITADLEVLPYIYGPLIAHPWFNFGVTFELIVSFVIFSIGIIQFITVSGLLNRKSYSYKLSFIVIFLLFIANISLFGLYASAPAELNLEASSEASNFGAVMNGVCFLILFTYLRSPHVKTYLGVIQPESTIIEQSKTDAQEKPTPTKNKFFCRYCGKENIGDGVFCENCGKNLQE